MKTIEELDKIIATAQAEKEQMLKGDDEIKKGCACYKLYSDGDILPVILGSFFEGSLSQGNISKSREWLEMIKRRREIETKMLKYADWECENEVSLTEWSDGTITWEYGAYDGVIPMSQKSANRCLNEMNHDDLKFYLTWGRG